MPLNTRPPSPPLSGGSNRLAALDYDGVLRTSYSTLKLSRIGPPVLAAGAWFKNTVCAMRGDEALLSASVGDLDTPQACEGFDATMEALSTWMGEPPAAIACDLHPDFHSSRAAAGYAHELGVPLIPVQHHHAHIAALCAEHGIEGPVLGLALDGVGLGTDGQAWGGELLQVNGAQFERLGHFRPLALPGGDRAAREPWRMAAAVLHALGRSKEIAARFSDEPAAAMLPTLIERGINSPMTSSAGRVFDAAAGLLGLSRRMEVEAQAAIALEQAATRHIAAHGWPMPLSWHIDSEGTLDLLPALGALTDETNTDLGAARFHATLVEALAAWAVRAADRTGVTILACGGGCFLNRLLSLGLRERLDATGLFLREATQVSPGDAGIALGQAWIARQILEN
ncbi:MAG: carbamoyltransferase HypF [Rhodocyclaceae bacterium]|nr:carbamoyltransferase HypF [Rhodocyclaceae bacterium]